MGPGDEFGGTHRILAAGEPFLGQAEIHGESDQTLLGAIVEIALDTAQLRGRTLHRRVPALRQLLDPPSQHGLLVRRQQHPQDGLVDGGEQTDERRREIERDETHAERRRVVGRQSDAGEAIAAGERAVGH